MLDSLRFHKTSRARGLVFVPGQPWYLCHVAATIRRRSRGRESGAFRWARPNCRRIPHRRHRGPGDRTDAALRGAGVATSEAGPRRPSPPPKRQLQEPRGPGVPLWPQDLALRGGFLPEPGRKFALLNPFGPGVNLEYRSFTHSPRSRGSGMGFAFSHDQHRDGQGPIPSPIPRRIAMDEIKKRLESELSHTVSRIRRMGGGLVLEEFPGAGENTP